MWSEKLEYKAFFYVDADSKKAQTISALSYSATAKRKVPLQLSQSHNLQPQKLSKILRKTNQKKPWPQHSWESYQIENNLWNITINPANTSKQCWKHLIIIIFQ